MKRRNFLGALTAIFAGGAWASKAGAAPALIESVIRPLADGYGFYEFGTLDGMTYQHVKFGDKESTMYVTTDGKVGLAQTSPQAVLHVLELERLSCQTS